MKNNRLGLPTQLKSSHSGIQLQEKERVYIRYYGESWLFGVADCQIFNTRLNESTIILVPHMELLWLVGIFIGQSFWTVNMIGMYLLLSEQLPKLLHRKVCMDDHNWLGLQPLKMEEVGGGLLSSLRKELTLVLPMNSQSRQHLSVKLYLCLREKYIFGPWALKRCQGNVVKVTCHAQIQVDKASSQSIS